MFSGIRTASINGYYCRSNYCYSYWKQDGSTVGSSESTSNQHYYVLGVCTFDPYAIHSSYVIRDPIISLVTKRPPRRSSNGPGEALPTTSIAAFPQSDHLVTGKLDSLSP